MSFKLATFVIFISCMIIFIHYKAQMSAALNAKITTLPVNSWDEIYAKNMKVLIATGGVAESYFSMAPKGTIRRKIYDEMKTKNDTIGGRLL